jgi:hypothetical protein
MASVRACHNHVSFMSRSLVSQQQQLSSIDNTRTSRQRRIDTNPKNGEMMFVINRSSKQGMLWRNKW